MRSSVAVALIMAGAVVLLAPYVSTTFGTAQVTSLIAELQRDVNLRGGMPAWYDTGCFIMGMLMIVVGAAASLRPEPAREAPPATHSAPRSLGPSAPSH